MSERLYHHLPQGLEFHHHHRIVALSSHLYLINSDFLKCKFQEVTSLEVTPGGFCHLPYVCPKNTIYMVLISRPVK